ncbi:MAG: 3-phosphoshikimate 1-carboxyvinyltransferase [Candidatus Omnitrophica bacterium]|nr:3-phosphoshikimate 1-carboxyvinyltransferase [Candidatus Omnitrophota bacterium]
MSFSVTQSSSGLKGTMLPGGDKSIAHRAVMIASLADGLTSISNFPVHDDSAATLRIFRSLGVKIKQHKNSLEVFGKGLFGLMPAKGSLDAGESGTTLRLVLGILAGQDFNSKIVCGRSLKKRPMLRVTRPLRLMGALIKSRRAGKEEFPPLKITGGNLRPIIFHMPVASAQVKSCVLLAGLYANGITGVIEPQATRDHTERMLIMFGAKITRKAGTISLSGGQRLRSPGAIIIPGDISSAAFFIVAASLLKGSDILIKRVSINPTRTGILSVMRRMGADIRVINRKVSAEPFADIRVRYSPLKAVSVTAKEIPSLIDELPIIMVAACLARGKTVLKGVGELRVKETDRIRSMVTNLSKMGCRIEIKRSKKSEDLVIHGKAVMLGASVRSFGDHRTAMSMIVAGLAAEGRTTIDDISCISKSFPDFIKVLRSLIVK